MLNLHSNFKRSAPVTRLILPSETIPGQSMSVTEMVARQNYGVPITTRSAGMQYGSEGSPLIPRLNCDIFDAIDYSRSELSKRVEAMKSKKEEAQRNDAADSVAADLVNKTTSSETTN